MPCGVTHLAVPDDFSWFGDQLDIQKNVGVIELQQGYQPGVKDPEVFGGQVEPVCVGAPQVTHVLARSCVAPRVAKEEELTAGWGIVDDAYPADLLTVRSLREHVRAPCAIQVPCHGACVEEFLVALVLPVGGVAAAGFEMSCRMLKLVEELEEFIRID